MVGIAGWDKGYALEKLEKLVSPQVQGGLGFRDLKGNNPSSEYLEGQIFASGRSYVEGG